MIIKCKKNYIYIDQFKLKCCVGKAGIKRNKIEGDKSTPFGFYKLGKLFIRKDRNKTIDTKLFKIFIKKNMGWCNDSRSNYYNNLIKIHKKTNFRYEKLYRNDYKYDLLIPILYNSNKVKKWKGSAIFIHLTKNYKPTEGCVGLVKKDFFILLKLIDGKTKINIYS